MASGQARITVSAITQSTLKGKALEDALAKGLNSAKAPAMDSTDPKGKTKQK